MRRINVALLVVVVVVGTVQVASANLITNGGFESPVATPGLFQYFPPLGAGTPTGWTGTNYAGYAATVTDGTSAPEGSQFGLIEIFGGTSPTLSQAIVFPTTGNYLLTYLDADRMSSGLGDLNYDVQLTQSGTTNIATGLNPLSTTFSPRSFTFFAQAGAGTITFFADGSVGGDRMAYFDAVSVEVVPPPAPEPASLLLCAVGMLGMQFIARRKRAKQSLLASAGSVPVF